MAPIPQKTKGRKEIDRIMIAKGKRGDFTPLQPDHYHNFYEIFYLHSGTCRFLLKDSVYQMEKGDLVFIAPGELHHALYSDNSCEVVWIYFKKSICFLLKIRKCALLWAAFLLYTRRIFISC